MVKHLVSQIFWDQTYATMVWHGTSKFAKRPSGVRHFDPIPLCMLIPFDLEES